MFGAPLNIAAHRKWAGHFDGAGPIRGLFDDAQFSSAGGAVNPKPFVAIELVSGDVSRALNGPHLVSSVALRLPPRHAGLSRRRPFGIAGRTIRPDVESVRIGFEIELSLRACDAGRKNSSEGHNGGGGEFGGVFRSVREHM